MSKTARETLSIPAGGIGPTLTTGQIAKFCNVAPKTVSNWCDSGRLKCYRIPGSRDRRVLGPDFVAFLEASGMPTGELGPGPAESVQRLREIGRRMGELQAFALGLPHLGEYGPELIRRIQEIAARAAEGGAA